MRSLGVLSVRNAISRPGAAQHSTALRSFEKVAQARRRCMAEVTIAILVQPNLAANLLVSKASSLVLVAESIIIQVTESGRKLRIRR